MKALLIYLDAPFQSWGCRSLFSHRDAGAAPSKSGISGLICAALGLRKGSQQERETIGLLADCRMTSYHVGGRMMKDYHTVRGTRLATGKESGGTVLTSRHYWESTRFVVALESEDTGFLCSVYYALKHPVWGGWFGRKCCIPAAPLVRDEVMAAETAHDCALDYFRKLEFSTPSISIEIFKEMDAYKTGVDTWQDTPVAYGIPTSSGREGRVYLPRYIKHEVKEVESAVYVHRCVENINGESSALDASV